jgi:hypothetical protein
VVQCARERYREYSSGALLCLATKFDEKASFALSIIPAEVTSYGTAIRRL